MNRLWLRLSLVFSFVTLGGALMFASLPRFFINVDLSPQTLMAGLSEPGGLVDRLVLYYKDNGTWAGTEPILRNFDLVLPRGFSGQPTILIFADVNGTILYDAFDQYSSESLLDEDRTAAVPIVVDGIVRGYIILQRVKSPDAALASGNELLRDLLNSLIVFAVLVGLLGVVAGTYVSRQLVAPLSELADTVREFGKNGLARRARVHGPSEVRDVASAFNEMADALAEGENLRRSLVADVAHELRTPLSVLQANLEAILDGIYPLSRDEIETLKAQTDLLRRLVDDLHELAQAESRQLPMNTSLVRLNELITGVIESFEAVATQHGLTLKAVLPDQPVSLTADSGRLVQVLHNLIHNAITHTPAGAITVTLAPQPEQVVISVADTGTGIAMEDQARIFDRFYRTDQARSRTSGGAGLGLAIARAIVDLHGGTITVSSTGIVGQGTTFTITLPSTPPSAPP